MTLDPGSYCILFYYQVRWDNELGYFGCQRPSPALLDSSMSEMLSNMRISQASKTGFRSPAFEKMRDYNN
jgi:hypothetical protein